jgi:hypothetical protein
LALQSGGKFRNVPTGTWLNFTTKDVEILYDVDVIAVARW